MNVNVKDELKDHVNGMVVVAVDVQAAHVQGNYQFRQGDNWEKFLQSLDWEYDNGYGSQELFGTIWYQDGTWSDRSESDGLEWWEYRVRPEIPTRVIESK